MRPPTACEFCRSVTTSASVWNECLGSARPADFAGRTRRRRCDRLQDSGDGPCALCRKHNVPCIPSTTPSSESRPRHARQGSSASVVRTSTSLSSPRSGNRTVISQGAKTPVAELALHTSPASTVTSAPAVQNGHGEGSELSLPPASVSFYLASLYFDYIHDQLHTLFQKPAFMSDLTMGKIPLVIRYAMIALAARFSSHEMFSGISPRARGVRYARKAASLLDVSDVCLTSIQACVMLGACRIIEGDARGEAVYYGIACRMAQLLDLPHRPCQTRLEREVNIRGNYRAKYMKY